MNKPKTSLEELSDLEHQQWIYWSKSLAGELKDIRQKLDEAMDINSVVKQIDVRLEKWVKNWKPYDELTEDVKEFDRIWARKIIDIMRRDELLTLADQKAKILEIIKSIMTDWKVEQITCQCQECKNVKYELIERDKILRLIERV